MIRILYRHRSTGIVAELPPDKLAAALQDKLLDIWVDLIAPTEEEWKRVLETDFRFHPLAVEDAIRDSHLPKLDDFNNYLFLVIHTVRLGMEKMSLSTHEIDIFLGANFLVTMHTLPSPTLDRCFQAAFHEKHGLARGPAFLLYEILDKQVDAYIPLIEDFEERLEELGDRIFYRKSNTRIATLNDILTAKTTALRLRRFLIPQRELINRLATLEYGVIPAEMRIYFRDVYDHMVRLADLSSGMMDLADSTIEIHLALANNRMNDIVKVLTIISTIFIPLTFLAGVYGMNFTYMPELDWRFGYPLAWLVFLVIAASLLYVFWKWGWFNRESDIPLKDDATVWEKQLTRQEKEVAQLEQAAATINQRATPLGGQTLSHQAADARRPETQGIQEQGNQEQASQEPGKV